jgi:hypothetical protein
MTPKDKQFALGWIEDAKKTLAKKREQEKEAAVTNQPMVTSTETVITEPEIQQESLEIKDKKADIARRKAESFTPATEDKYGYSKDEEGTWFGDYIKSDKSIEEVSATSEQELLAKLEAKYKEELDALEEKNEEEIIEPVIVSSKQNEEETAQDKPQTSSTEQKIGLEGTYPEIPLVTQDDEKWKKQLGQESILRYMGIIFYSKRKGFHELNDREFEELSEETKNYLLTFYEKHKKELFEDKYQVHQGGGKYEKYKGKDLIFDKLIDTDREKIDRAVLLFSQDIYGTRGNGLMGGVGGSPLKLDKIEYPPEAVLKNLDEVFKGDHTQFRAELYALGKDGLEKLRDAEIAAVPDSYKEIPGIIGGTEKKSAYEVAVEEIKSRYAEIIAALEAKKEKKVEASEPIIEKIETTETTGQQTVTQEGTADYEKIFTEIEENNGDFSYVTSEGTKILAKDRDQLKQTIKYGYEVASQIKLRIENGTYAALITSGKVSKEKVIQVIEALGFTIPKEISEAVAPKAEEVTNELVVTLKEKPAVPHDPPEEILASENNPAVVTEKPTGTENPALLEVRKTRAEIARKVIQEKLGDKDLTNILVGAFNETQNSFVLSFEFEGKKVEGTVYMPTKENSVFKFEVPKQDLGVATGPVLKGILSVFGGKSPEAKISEAISIKINAIPDLEILKNPQN